MVPEWLRAALGEVTWPEIALAGLWSACIVLYRQLPRMAEALGALFERNR